MNNSMSWKTFLFSHKVRNSNHSNLEIIQNSPPNEITDRFLQIMLELLYSEQRRRGWVGGGGARAPLASEIQEIFGNFKTLYQLHMCVITSCDLNVNVGRKDIKLCPHRVPTHDAHDSELSRMKLTFVYVKELPSNRLSDSF